MNNYLQILQQVLSIPLPQSEEKQFCLSIYYPFGSPKEQSHQLQLQFKAFVQEELKKFDFGVEFKFLRNKLVEQLENLTTEFDIEQSGIAIFLKFELKDEYKGNFDFQPFENLVFTHLHLECQPEFLIAKSFALDQLIFNLNNNSTAVILDLHSDRCTIYKLAQTKLEQLNFLQNKFIELMEERLINNADINRSGQQGENQILEPEKHFLRENILPQLKEFDFKYDYLVIFYASSLAPLMNHGHNDFQQLSAEVVQQQLDLHNDLERLKAETQSILAQKYLQHKQQKLQEAKDKYQHFLTDWSDICNYARQGGIETLFIKPNLVKSGYLMDGNLVFLKQEEESREVENLVPYLISSVLDHGGRISILIGENFESESEVAALIRF